MNIAVFASGRGTNFSAIIRAVKRGSLKVRLALLVCDNPVAPVIQRARRAGVPVALIQREDYPSRREFEAAIIRVLKEYKIDFIALAGFMRLLGKDLVRAFRGRLVNIHPSLLPSFKGAHAIDDAFHYGVKMTGVTVHFVDEKMDHGPIILQEPVKIENKDTLASLEARIHKVEHVLYPEAIRLCALRKVTIGGRKTKVIR